MKEIKFRAWDSEKEEMAKVISIGGEDITLQDDEGRTWDSVTGYIAYPMQYTGIKDKNGVEIYEGDIIKGPFDFGPFGVKDRTAQVYFNPHSGYQWHYWMDLSEIEVIGNIYQNPDLTKGEEE